MKLEFDSLILSICCSQFKKSVTTVEVFLYEIIKFFIMTDNNTLKVSEISVIVNLNSCMTFTAENFSSYLSFNLYFISIYTNNQLCYYHMIDTMLDTDKAAVKNQLKKHKTSLKLID